MGRIALYMIIAVSLTPAVFAQGVGTDDIANTDLRNIIEQVKKNPTAMSQVWGQVPSVSPVEVASLMDHLTEFASAGDQASPETVNALHKELGRQTAAFKAAHQAALPARSRTPDDLDDLYGQVFENKPHADPGLMKALAGSYETLYIQFGQYVNARFLASNKAGIPTYRANDGNRSADASQVGNAAEQHMVAYRTNMARTTADLKQLLNLETARR